MKRLFPYVVVLTAMGLTIGGALLQGRISHRWGQTQDFSHISMLLNEFPDKVGDWVTREKFELPPVVADTLQCTGYLNRQFVNEVTGEVITMAVLIGPSGPMAVHNPEVCYSSREFTQIGHRQPVVIDDSGSKKVEFWVTDFESTGLQKSRLRVMFSWSADGEWAAVDNPRLVYAGKPFLFKIQVAASSPAGTDMSASDPCARFLKQFMPTLNQRLFGTET